MNEVLMRPLFRKKYLERLKKLNSFNKGGLVPSYGGRRGIDSIPAMLTPGELVVPANRVGDFVNSKRQSHT